jgi:chaperone required for assembly of F1-ATPase
MLNFSVRPANGGWEIAGTKTTALTKGGRALVLPAEGLAHAMAAELAVQGAKSPLFLLASAVIDAVRPDRPAHVAQVGRFLDTDLVCYRAPDPADLAARQATAWDPVLAWGQARGVGPLSVTQGLTQLAQPQAAHTALAEALNTLDDWHLLVAHRATHQVGSALLGLMFASRAAHDHDVFAAAYVEELYQNDRYGEDAELKKRLDHARTVLGHLRSFRDLLA